MNRLNEWLSFTNADTLHRMVHLGYIPSAGYSVQLVEYIMAEPNELGACHRLMKEGSNLQIIILEILNEWATTEWKT